MAVMLTAWAKLRVVVLMSVSYPVGVTNHGTVVSVALPSAAAAKASCSDFVATNATPTSELPAIAAAISPTTEAALPWANVTTPAELRPFAASASAIDEFSDCPHASLRITVTTDLTPASAMTWAIKCPCLAVVIAVRNRLSPGVDSDSSSEA